MENIIIKTSIHLLKKNVNEKTFLKPFVIMWEEQI